MRSAVARRNTAGVRRDGLGRGPGRRTAYTGQLPRCSALPSAPCTTRLAKEWHHLIRSPCTSVNVRSPSSPPGRAALDSAMGFVEFSSNTCARGQHTQPSRGSNTSPLRN